MIRALPVVLLTVACGGPDAPPKPPPKPLAVSSVERYMPLENDTVLAYETEKETTGERGILMMHITRPREGRADLTVGEKVRRLELAPDGIRLSEGGYLLKAPLDVGSEWKSGGGRTKVTAIDKAVEVPAGKFVGCIETVEVSGGTTSGRRVTTVFCPDVGITLLDVEGVVEDEYIHERALLRSFGPRVDIGAM